MLKQLLIIFFILFNCTINSAFAQDTTKTKLSKWGIGVQVNTIEKSEREINYNEANEYSWGYFSPSIEDNNMIKDNSLSVGLIGHYILNENIAFRLRGGISKIRVERTKTVLEYTIRKHTSIANKQQDNFYFASGVELRNRKGRFSFYGGMELYYKLLGRTKSNFYYSFTEINNTSIWYSSEVSILNEKGYSFGVNSFVGCRYNLIKNFSINPEFAFAFLYTKFNGDTIGEKVEKGNPIPSGTNFKGIQHSTNTTWGNTILQASLTIQYFF